jgi:hypothetical protein
MSRPKFIFAAAAACLLAGGLTLEIHNGSAGEGTKAGTSLPGAAASAATPFKASADGTFVAPPMPPPPQMPSAPGMAPSPQAPPPPPPTLAPPLSRAP